MDNVAAEIILAGSVITSLGVIFNVVMLFGKHSKHGISKFIEKEMQPNFDKINNAIDDIKEDMKNAKTSQDSDRMQQLRYECLKFSSDIRKGIPKTRQEYEEIFRMEEKYDKLIEQYSLTNGYMEEEMLFVHSEYRALKDAK